MKPINFITPVPPRTKREVRYWLLLNTVCVVGIFMWLTISLFSYGYQYYMLATEHAQIAIDQHGYALLRQQYNEKNEAHQARAHQFEKIKTYQTSPKNPIALLETCNKIIGAAHIQSYAITPTTFEITYTTPSLQHTQHLLPKLQAIPTIQQVQLVSLQRNNNSITSTVRAERLTKKRAT